MPKLRTIETRLAVLTLVHPHAWCAGTFWHAAVLRLAFVQRGDHLFYGSPELMVVAGGAAITLGMLGVSLFLTYRAEAAPN